LLFDVIKGETRGRFGRADGWLIKGMALGIRRVRGRAQGEGKGSCAGFKAVVTPVAFKLNAARRADLMQMSRRLRNFIW